MKLHEARLREDYPHKKIERKHQQFVDLISELNQKELTDDIVQEVNPLILQVNNLDEHEPKFKSCVNKQFNAIIKLIAAKLRLVPKKFYQQMWFPLGMAIFGIPVGLIISMLSSNYAFIGIGLPIGLAIGAFLGSKMDDKAEKEGRQLNVEYSI